jgi:hypothetical protein
MAHDGILHAAARRPVAASQIEADRVHPGADPETITDKAGSTEDQADYGFRDSSRPSGLFYVFQL